MNAPRESQFSGCLVGQCLGDALGFIVEGYPPAACRQYIDEILRVGKAQQGRRGPFPFGQYSDDSQLARELLQSFVACGSFDPADYAARVAAIFAEERIVGRGRATEEAARRLMQGVPWEKAGTPPPSAGNGSAMRAGPIGLLFYGDPQALIRVAHDQGRITHLDPRCSAGAVAIAGAVALALRPENIEPARFSSQLASWTRPFDTTLAEALGLMTAWIYMPPATAVTHISTVGVPSTHRDEWAGISPFVTTSVLWSLYSFLRTPEDYWESVCTAIAVGGDVDTTAAMTAAISGARVGLERLPQGLAREVNDNGTWAYEELVELARGCHAIAMGR